MLAGNSYSLVVFGGSIGRKLRSDNIEMVPVCYVMTDILGRVHFDTLFAGLSFVSDCVGMMDFSVLETTLS